MTVAVEKLRVAVFNTQPPHRYFGGVERRILETGKRLNGKVEFTVYSGTKAGFRSRANLDGVSVVPCRSTDYLFPLDNWTFNRSLSKMTGKIQADICEAHNVSGYGFQKALKKQNIKTPFITTVHGVLADEYTQAQAHQSTSSRGKLANYFMKRLANIEKESAQNANLVVTISKYSQKKIEELYCVDPAKIRIVPNGVDPEKFKPNQNYLKNCKHPTAEDGQVVLFVGRLIPRKGVGYLIEAAKQVVKEHSQTRFVVAGDGPLKSRLIADVNNARLGSNFDFIGDVAEGDLPRLYSCADVFAFPSIQEGQGIVLLEAQASALPVVAFDVSGVSEAVVDKETGLLVEPDVTAFAQALLNVLSDEALRQRLGAEGRKRILKELTWDLCAEKMLIVYREAAQLSRA